MKERTVAQKERQEEQYRKNGQYAKVNPCYVCGKSAGVDYCAHQDTDGLINDELLCICNKCADKLCEFDGVKAVEIAYKPNHFYEGGVVKVALFSLDEEGKILKSRPMTQKEQEEFSKGCNHFPFYGGFE